MSAMGKDPKDDEVARALGLRPDQILHVRAPNPTKEQLAVLAALDAPQPYRWTTDDDEIALDAVIVGIGGTSAEMLSIGLSYVEPMASIYWSAWVGPGGQIIDAGGEMGPWPVPEALIRAEVVRAQFGFPRVAITMEERGIWRDEWGTLADQEGY
jgi:hypothetical protein